MLRDRRTFPTHRTPRTSSSSECGKLWWRNRECDGPPLTYTTTWTFIVVCTSTVTFTLYPTSHILNIYCSTTTTSTPTCSLLLVSRCAPLNFSTSANAMQCRWSTTWRIYQRYGRYSSCLQRTVAGSRMNVCATYHDWMGWRTFSDPDPKNDGFLCILKIIQDIVIHFWNVKFRDEYLNIVYPMLSLVRNGVTIQCRFKRQKFLSNRGTSSTGVGYRTQATRPAHPPRGQQRSEEAEEG